MAVIKVPLDAERRVTGRTIALFRHHLDAEDYCDMCNSQVSKDDHSLAFYVIGDTDGYRVIQLFGQRVDDE